jgi:hypothetical protein
MEEGVGNYDCWDCLVYFKVMLAAEQQQHYASFNSVTAIVNIDNSFWCLF